MQERSDIVKLLGAVLACGVLGATPAAAVTCPAVSAPGAPVAWSASHHYFVYNGKTIPLIGLSHEYICHISQPDRMAKYCTLDNYKTQVLPAAAANKNNLIRMWAILNNSPGRAVDSQAFHQPKGPYPNEQPFLYMGNGKWDLSTPDPNYLVDLERVVCEAYNQGIVVELTLLDPWCTPWETSAFNSANSLYPTTQGFTQRQYFATFEDRVNLVDTGQNLWTRNKQIELVGQVVDQLKKYPNLIWELANEPDFIPSGIAVTVQDVMSWQALMRQTVLQHDTTHLIAINGETTSSFGWTMPSVKEANLHYANNTLAAQYGATELQKDTSPATGGKANLILGFNENNAIPDQTGQASLARTASDVRAEAWEFTLGGGALFDGYSLDRSQGETQAASSQLRYLAEFLTPPTLLGGIPSHPQSLDPMHHASCNGAGDWCRGVPTWGIEDYPTQCSLARVYWSTTQSSTDYALYLHHGVLRSQRTPPGGKNDGYLEIACGDGVSRGYRTGGLQFSVGTGGCWSVMWKDPKSGVVRSSTLMDLAPNQFYNAPSPPLYLDDIVFYVGFWRSASCSY